MSNYAITTPRMLAAVAGIMLAAAATGLALAGWMDHGAAIFMTMAETGLSWCF